MQGKQNWILGHVKSHADGKTTASLARAAAPKPKFSGIPVIKFTSVHSTVAGCPSRSDCVSEQSEIRSLELQSTVESKWINSSIERSEPETRNVFHVALSSVIMANRHAGK